MIASITNLLILVVIIYCLVVVGPPLLKMIKRMIAALDRLSETLDIYADVLRKNANSREEIAALERQLILLEQMDKEQILLQHLHHIAGTDDMIKDVVMRLNNTRAEFKLPPLSAEELAAMSTSKAFGEQA